MTAIHTAGVVAFQSDRVEELVDRLVVELVRDEQTAGVAAPFVDHCLVLPTRNLETYLTYEIAARRGVTAGLAPLTMEQFLEQLLPEDDDGAPPIRPLDQMATTRLVLSLLDDEALIGREVLEPVRRFIRPDGPRGSDPDVVRRRKFQLAFRLARLFEEYGYSRRNLLEQWHRGELAVAREYPETVTPPQLEIERWQMVLWRQLFGPDGRARHPGGDEKPWMTLPEAVMSHARDDDRQLNWPESVHIFAHSYLPRFFRDLFSTRTETEHHRIALYVLTPSLQHFSHGVAGDRDEDPVFDLISDDSILAGDEYPLALELWGRAGRDYQRMIDDVAWDRVDVSADEPRGCHTLLHHFQRVIRHMETASEVFADQPLPADHKSINFWSTASIQRECEAIASEIYELVTTHEHLRFNDIAVVVQPTDRTLYQTHLQAAFGQTGDIPCNVIDVEATETSPFLEACELLLALPLSEFRRRELLSLLVHPAVVANYPEANEDAWMQWCDELNIFQGAGAQQLDDTYLDEDRFTWRQGLRRLVLGAFMSQPDPERPQPMPLDGHSYLPHATNHGELDTVALLAMLADELIGHATAAVDEIRPLGEWLEHFADRISHHLKPRDHAEHRTRMRLVGRFAEVAESDACPEEPVSYRIAYEFAMAAMADIDQSHGQYLADGVVISAFRPMRPIPFQVVFVTGMGEGKFPAPDPPDMLDLRRVKSEPHDVNPRYRDQYMFLETLISTRCRLYLSWVGRHAVTGDPIEPASAVHQLREILLGMAPRHGERAEQIRAELEERTRFVEHPLRRWDDRYFPQFGDEPTEPSTIDARGPDAIPPGPESRRDGGEPLEEALWPNHHRQAQLEARARAVRRRLDEHLPAGHRPTIHQLREALDEGMFARLAELVNWQSPRAGRPERNRRSLVLHLRDLRHFLQSPLQGAARVLLGLYAEQLDDALDADHEPFEAEFLTRLQLVRQTLRAALAEGDLGKQNMRRLFDERAESARLGGELPSGVYFEAERQKCLGLLDRYATALTDEGLGGENLARIRFGSTRRRREADEVVDPVVLQVQLDDEPVDVELHGTIEALGPDLQSLVFAAGRKVKPKYIIAGGLNQVVLRAAGLDAGGDTTVVTRRGRTTRHSVADQTTDQAREYLRVLLGDLLDGIHDYFLPVEFAADLLAGDVDDYHRHAHRKKQPGWGRDVPDVSSVYGPVRRWQQVAPPDREVAERIVRRRFAPFAEALVGE